MRKFYDASREGNDCWINDCWYWCGDASVNIIVNVYDDGRGSEYIRVRHYTSWENLPEPVRVAAEKITAEL